MTNAIVSAGDIGVSRKSLADFGPGDTIRYTTDGSIPDRSSPFVVYGNNSVHVSRTTTFKARLYRSGYLPTDPQSHTVFVAGTDFYYAYGNSWNVVCLPVTRTDRRRVSVFPTSVSYAYSYDEGAGYVRQDTLQYGRGYLLKFSEEQTVYIPGSLRTTDTIAIQTGWNLIGTISRPVPDSAVRQIPDRIVTSYYYGYTRGYAVARTLWPSMGYWVKASAPGVLIVSQGNQGLTKAVANR